jgi:hypothetical protein
MPEPQLLQVPQKVHSIDELCGVIRQMPVLNIVVVIETEDQEVLSMTVNGTTAERMNWMLDRAKLLLHRAD